MSNHGSSVTTEVPDGPQAYTLSTLRLQENEPRYMRLCEAKASHHKECGPSFLLSLHTSYTMDCPAALEVEDVSLGCYVQ